MAQGPQSQISCLPVSQRPANHLPRIDIQHDRQIPPLPVNLDISEIRYPLLIYPRLVPAYSGVGSCGVDRIAPHPAPCGIALLHARPAKPPSSASQHVYGQPGCLRDARPDVLSDCHRRPGNPHGSGAPSSVSADHLGLVVAPAACTTHSSHFSTHPANCRGT